MSILGENFSKYYRERVKLLRSVSQVNYPILKNSDYGLGD
jgi:hypothetical protein